MIQLKKLLLLILLIFPVIANSAIYDFDEPVLGKYGIQYRATLEEYQSDYLGKTVMYIPEGKNGSARDISQFIDKGGKYNTEYTIVKISGNPKNITILLQEIGTKNKVKFEFANTTIYESHKFYLNQYKEKTTLPLLILDVFNEDVKQIKGKEIGNLIFVDYCLQEHPSQTRETKYPVPVAIVQDKSDNTVYSTYPNSLKDLDCIGRVITNPKFKCTYTVVSVRDKYNALYNSRDPYYTVKNSITKETREIHYKETDEAFMFDGTGKLISSLLNVENSTNKKGVVGNNSYSDDLIDMAILAEEYQFSFILNNRSNNSMKIIWNDAVFVDIDGSTSKIMHSGIKYVDKEKDQPASVIVKGAKLEDIAIPVQKVFYHNFEWSNQSLFEKADKKIKGQIIKLMLPIQIGNSIIEYVFEFGLVYKYDHPELLVE